MLNLDTIVRKFLIFEGNEIQPDIFGYIQVVNEILQKLKPASLRDSRYIDMARKHIQEVSKHVRRLNEEITSLKEQVQILEEKKRNK